MDTRKFFSWVGAALIILLSVAPAAARLERGAEVRLISPIQVVTEPQSIHVLSFLVINRSGREFRFREGAVLPRGWSTIMPLTSFVLPPGAETSRLLSIQIPLGAAEGRHKVVYSVEADRDPAVRGSHEIEVVVLPMERSDLVVESQPVPLIAGENYSITAQLLNSGNTTRSFRIRAKATDSGSTAGAVPERGTLSPGENAEVIITGRVSPQFTGSVLAVQIIAEEDKSGKITDMASVTVLLEVISSTGRKPEVFHILPTMLSLSATRSSNGGTSPFFEWSGSGSLDEEGKRNLAFSLTGPSLEDSYAFSRVEEFWLTYSNPAMGFKLGDQVYGVSPLTVSSSYGRGAGVDFKSTAKGKWAFGGFRVKNRFGIEGWLDEGIYAEHLFSEDSSIRFNMTRSETDATSTKPASTDNLWSLEARLRTGADGDLEMEYAKCDTDRPSKGDDDAYRVLWRGLTASRIAYAFQKIHAGADFWGYYHSYDYESGALSFPLGSRLRAGIAASKYRNNIGMRREESDTSTREELVQATLNFDMGSGWFFVLGFDDFRREDELPPARYNYSEQSVWMRLGRSFGQFSWSVEPRFSYQKDYLRGESTSPWNASILLSYFPNPDLSLSFFYNLGDNDILQDSYLLRGSTSFGASLFWRLSPQWTLNVAYSRSGINDRGQTESDQLDVIAACTLRDGQMITIEVSKSGDETEYRLSYMIPVGIKTVKKKNVGILRGRIFDGMAPDKPGLENIIVRVGPEAVATGPGGSFIFPALEVGSHRVYIDPKSIGYGFTTDKKYPLTLEIAPGGEEVDMEIGIIKGAALRGRIILDIPREQDKGEGYIQTDGKNVRPGEAVRILVELSREDETARRSTNERGEFVFDNIRPGLWNLKFYGSGLPAGYVFEVETETIELKSGDSMEFLNRAYPMKRAIKFIDSGALSSSSSKGKK